MNGFICKRLAHSAASGVRSHQFVVCGGGAGGLAVASSLARRFGKEKVAVIEPSDVSHSDLMNNYNCISKNYDNVKIMLTIGTLLSANVDDGWGRY